MANAPGFKNLLKAVIGHSPNTEARVTNLASATELIQEISKGSATSVLKEVKLALGELNGLDWVSAKERIRTTLYLDEKSQPFILEVMGALLVRASDPLFMARALPLLVETWQQMATSYRKWLEATEVSQLQTAEGQLATCRLLALQVRMAQCLLVRAKPVHEQIWTFAHKLYQRAERAQTTRNPQQLYPADSFQVTPGSLLSVLHLLTLAPYQTLSAGHLFALCDWLWVRQQGIQLLPAPSERSTLVIDLATLLPARPQRRGPQTEQSRFIECPTLQDDLRTRAPAFMNATTPLYLQLSEAWGGRFRVFCRQSARQSVDKEAVVRLTWTPLLAMVNDPAAAVKDELTPKPQTRGADWKPLAPGEEEAKPVKVERVRIINQSSGGLGLLLPRQLDAEPILGDLIGVAPVEGGQALLGEVVWLDRTQTRYLEAGVRLLGEDAVVVRAQRVGAPRKVEAIAVQRCLPGAADWTGLIMPPGQPVPAGEYLVGVDDSPELCRLVPVPTRSDRLILAEALPV